MYTKKELLINDLNNEKQIAIFLKDNPQREKEYQASLRKIRIIEAKIKIVTLSPSKRLRPGIAALRSQ